MKLISKLKIDFSLEYNRLLFSIPRVINNIINNSSNEDVALDLLKQLYNINKNILSKANDINLPIIYSVINNNYKLILDFLIKVAGLDINQVDRYGKTALHYLIEDKIPRSILLEKVELLLSYGANPYKKDNSTSTVIDICDDKVIENKLISYFMKKSNINEQIYATANESVLSVILKPRDTEEEAWVKVEHDYYDLNDIMLIIEDYKDKQIVFRAYNILSNECGVDIRYYETSDAFQLPEDLVYNTIFGKQPSVRAGCIHSNTL